MSRYSHIKSNIFSIDKQIFSTFSYMFVYIALKWVNIEYIYILLSHIPCHKQRNAYWSLHKFKHLISINSHEINKQIFNWINFSFHNLWMAIYTLYRLYCLYTAAHQSLLILLLFIAICRYTHILLCQSAAADSPIVYRIHYQLEHIIYTWAHI